MSKEEVRRLMRGALVVCDGRRWLVTFNDWRYERLYLRALPPSGKLVDDDFACSIRRIARYGNVTPLGVCHPTFSPRLEIGYAVVATELGPAGPQHIAAYVSRVEGEYVWYWRADGAGRQREAIRSRGLWVTCYASEETGRKAWQRDETRYAGRAGSWWLDGRPVVHDYGLQRLARVLAAGQQDGSAQRVLDLGADDRPEVIRSVRADGGA